jgi:hypothetical protein
MMSSSVIISAAGSNPGRTNPSTIRKTVNLIFIALPPFPLFKKFDGETASFIPKLLSGVVACQNDMLIAQGHGC